MNANKVVIVTGMSGAGRSTALRALEDIGYEAVDNLPLSLLSGLVHPGSLLNRPLAVGIDIRTRDFGLGSAMAGIEQLIADSETEVKILFLDCDNETLSRRYTETRRRHPLAVDRPLLDGIRHERELVSDIKTKASMLIDTSNLSPASLKKQVERAFNLENTPGLVTFITSFSYRQGLPREADLVFDVRFLRNPHYDPLLRPLCGKDKAVGDHIKEDTGFADFFQNLLNLVVPLLPRYAEEGKSYLTIGIGCTGGKHRSVFVAEKLANELKNAGHKVELRHRELTSVEEMAK